MPLRSFFKKYFYKAGFDTLTKQPTLKLDNLRVVLATFALTTTFVLFSILVFALVSALNKPAVPPLPETTPQTNIDLQKQKQLEASAAAEKAKTPQAQLTKAYNEIVGAPDFLKEITLVDGLASISYTINSKDNLTILTTGYQNFADFADRVFNIKEVARLRLIVYATGIIDAQGQSSTPAMKLEISRSKSEKINWQQNKYRYDTYPDNLEVNEINPALKKEYDPLVKKKP